jgi:outer membrane receptor protein involved in Fe transport
MNLTGSSYGLKRIDMFYGGPLSDTWFVALGGFYRRSDGIRATQFPADNGGQFSTNLRHATTGGEFALHVRATDDKNVWLLPIPLTVANGTFSSFPGFPAGTGTFAGNDTRLVNLEVNNGGGIVARDLADGRGLKAAVVGASLDQILGNGWTLGARVNYLMGHADTNGLVPNGLPLTLGDLLAGVARPAAGGDAAGAATAVFAAAGTPVPLTQAIENVGWWSVTKALKSFTADVRLSKAIGDRAATTLGAYFADYSSDDLWYLNKNMLLTAETNGRRVDVSFANGVVFSRNGFAPSPWQYDVNDSNSAKRVALFAAEEWKVTDALRVDVGGRYEQYKVAGTAEGQNCGADLDADPKTLYDSNSCYLNGTHTTVAYPFTVGSDGHIEPAGYQGRYALTAGLNYLLSSRNSVFARFNNGFRLPSFDGVPPQNGTSAQPVQTIKQYEVGYRVASRPIDVDATFFGNRFEGLAFQQLGSAECPGPNGCPAVAGAKAFGAELEAEMRPARGLRFGVTGTYTHSVFTGYDDKIGDDFTGNQVLRQPRWSGRMSAAYTFAWLSRQITPYTTWTSIGRRFSDNANLQLLPGYSKLDAGISCEIFRRTSFHVVGDNLTNVIGLTEGDPRAIKNVIGSVALARPILGRSLQASIAYTF